MLKIVCGKSGSGKTHFICQKIKQDIDNGKRVYLIVPEQQSVISEKQIVSLCSNKCNMNLEVLNFTRLANRVFREYGGVSQKYIDEGGKSLILDSVIEELSGALEQYSSDMGNDFILRLSAQLSNIERRGAVKDINRILGAKDDEFNFDGILKAKLCDLSLIYLAYKRKLHENYSDPADDSERLCEALDEFPFFEGSNVYIDGFYEFCAQEYNVIRRILAQADNVYVSLIRGFDLRDESFLIGDRTFNKLREMSSDTDIIKRENDMRTVSAGLGHIKEYLFDDFALPCEESDGADITVCRNIYEECAAAAHKINLLVKSGVKYSEISVAVRSPEDYRGIIDMYFEKHGIPFFFSARDNITLKPLLSFVFSSLDCICDSFSTESVQRYLKSGFSSLDNDDVYLIENYILTHSISGKGAWEKEWTMNPEGYGSVMTEALSRRLCKINELRKAVFLPLSEMSESMKRQNVRERCEALYEFLSRREILKIINERCEKLRENGDYSAANESITVWNILMNCLDQMVLIMGERRISVKKFREVLTLLCSNYSSARIPGAIDQVNIGEAGHMRCENVKHTFILGLCEGEFPKTGDGGALLTEKELRILGEAGIDAGETGEYAAARENMFFYLEVTRPSHGLHLMWRDSDMSGAENTRSAFLMRIEALMPNISHEDYSSSSALPATLEEAFDYLLNNLSHSDEKLRPLYDFFIVHPKYKDRLSYLMSARDNAVSEKKLSPDFFKNKDVYMSQSSFEKYVSCPYSYFVSNLLGAKAQRKAKIDFSIVGTFVHGILERFMKRTEGVLKTASADEIRKIADEIVGEYIAENLPEFDNSTPRFKYLIKRISRIAVLTVMSLADEMRESEFEPLMFEEKIGGDSIPQYETRLEDGSKLIFKGIVDRVDIYKSADGTEYVRIIDYKTGRASGTFSLRDVLNGFKLQMLIYLFAIKRGGINCGGSHKSVLPAGILYIPAVRPSLKPQSTLSDDEYSEEVRLSFKRSGLLLNDTEILGAMEKEPGAVYLPIKAKKDGSLSGGLATLEQFGLLESYINRFSSELINRLKKGDIEPDPFTVGKNSCEYCDNFPICRFDGVGRKYCMARSGSEWSIISGEEET